MIKISEFLLKLMTNSFIVALISTMIASVGNENSNLIQLLGFIGIYGTIITIWLTVLHFVSIVVGFLLKKK